eukprot:358050-Chlamydomonas_euryale.AAC.3
MPGLPTQHTNRLCGLAAGSAARPSRADSRWIPGALCHRHHLPTWMQQQPLLPTQLTVATTADAARDLAMMVRWRPDPRPRPVAAAAVAAAATAIPGAAAAGGGGCCRYHGRRSGGGARVGSQAAAAAAMETLATAATMELPAAAPAAGGPPLAAGTPRPARLEVPLLRPEGLSVRVATQLQCRSAARKRHAKYGQYVRAAGDAPREEDQQAARDLAADLEAL